MFGVVLSLGLFYFVFAQDLPEGSSCTSGGVQGTCRKAKVCPSVGLHVHEAETICSQDGEEPVVCCTDCYIDDVSQAAVTLDGIVWKTGGVRKSYDKCVEYASTLPYACKTGGVRLAVNKEYDDTSLCHRLKVTVRQDPAATVKPTRVDFPHLALLGNGHTAEEASSWNCQGSIISEKFVITTAFCGNVVLNKGSAAYVAVGIAKRSEDPARWQKLQVKRVVPHPQYSRTMNIHDVSLVQTATNMKFGVNVLPICLAEQPPALESAQVGVLVTREDDNNVKALIKKLTKQECSNLINPQHAINFTTQACYTHYNEELPSCRGSNGRPIYISGELKCMDYIIGMVSYGTSCEMKNGATVYTLIYADLPWIERVVWP